MSRFRFLLFVAGDGPRSVQARENLRRLCDELLGGAAEWSVVDVTADPDAAETHRVLTIPTVIRQSPAPLRRVTGDLSDLHAVLRALALPSAPLHPPTPEAG